MSARAVFAFPALPGGLALLLPGFALLLAGWAARFWSATLATYAVFVLLGFHLRDYRSRVPRWLL